MAQGGAAIELGGSEEGMIEMSLWAVSGIWEHIEIISPIAVYFKEAMGTAQAVRTSLSISTVGNKGVETGDTGEDGLRVNPQEHGVCVGRWVGALGGGAWRHLFWVDGWKGSEGDGAV